MAGLQLQPLPSAGQRAVDAQGNLDPVFRIALQSILDQLADAVNGVILAQEAADAAAASADAAQVAADAAQAAVDSLDIPPTATITVTTNTVLDGSAASVLVDATGGVVAITLPTALSGPALQTITKIDATGNAVNVGPGGGDTLNGGAGPVALTVQNEVRNFTSDQVSQWFG